MNNRFEVAAIAIFVAMVLDGMDGRVARLTNTQSAFGEQVRLAVRHDLVRRGAGAGHVRMDSERPGPLGLAGRVVYVAGAALRLARFNTNIAVVDKRYFQGLPSPPPPRWWPVSSGWPWTTSCPSMTA